LHMALHTRGFQTVTLMRPLLFRKSTSRRFLVRPARFVSLAFLMLAASCSGVSTSSPSSSPGGGSAEPANGSAGVPAVARGALSAARATGAPLLPPAGTIYFGAYVNYLNTIGPFETQTKDFEGEVGRKLAIHSEYHKWNDNFPAAPEVDDWRNHRIPVISWDCGDTDYDVINGDQDSVITAKAQAFKTYKHPVFLRWFWEMNLPYADENRAVCEDPSRDQDQQFNPTDYVGAWQHIHAIFAAQGVTNVVWLWNPSGNITISPLPYYPGATETDWIGFDHYDVTGNEGLYNTLLAPYQLLTQNYPEQPIMVGETGSPGKDNNQGTYLSTAPTILQADFPAILGFLYYDAYGHRQDWRLTPAGISAFATAGATQYFSGYEQTK